MGVIVQRRGGLALLGRGAHHAVNLSVDSFPSVRCSLSWLTVALAGLAVWLCGWWQSSMEAFLFIVGAPFTGFAGATLANWRFEMLRDDNVPITSAFIVRDMGLELRPQCW